MGASPRGRYTWVAIILHWAMALGIVALIVMGWLMTHAKLSPMRLFQLYQLHKSIGVTILLAAVLRLVWRLTNRPPELPADMVGPERAIAVGSHRLLYVLLFALPLTGWALVSASVLDIPTVLFGLVPWPDLPVLSSLPDKAPVEHAFKGVHAWLAWGLLGLVGLHGAAALRHHLVKRDNVLVHMLPFIRRTPAGSA